jgi:hypothetical protein
MKRRELPGIRGVVEGERISTKVLGPADVSNA